MIMNKNSNNQRNNLQTQKKIMKCYQIKFNFWNNNKKTIK